MDNISTRLFTNKYGWAHEHNWIPRQVLQHPVLEIPYNISYSLLGLLGIIIASQTSIFLAIMFPAILLTISSLNFLQYFYKYPKYHSVLGLNDVRG